MSAAFTPGPWGVEATDFDLWIGPMRPDGGKVERVVVGLDADPTYTEAYTLRRNADARLIAAAPELYEALGAWLQAVGPASVMRARQNATAALAKARGEQ